MCGSVLLCRCCLLCGSSFLSGCCLLCGSSFLSGCCLFCGSSLLLLCQILCLFDIGAINGLELILHGHCLKSESFAFFREGSSLLGISIVALCVITQEHVCLSSVLDDILCHGKVTGAVAEGQQRRDSDLIDNAAHLVHLQILVGHVSFHEHLVIGRIGVVTACSISLPCRSQGVGGADDLIRRDPFTQSFLCQFTCERALCSAADIDLEVMFRQVLHQRDHGLIEGFSIGHILKTDSRFSHKCMNILSVIIYCISLKGLGRHLCSRSGRIRFRFSVQQGILQRFRKRLVFFIRRRICFVMQQTIHQHALVKIGREKFSIKGSVHIENGNTFRRCHIIDGRLIRDRLHICHNGSHSRRILRPVGNALNHGLFIAALCRRVSLVGILRCRRLRSGLVRCLCSIRRRLLCSGLVRRFSSRLCLLFLPGSIRPGIPCFCSLHRGICRTAFRVLRRTAVHSR